MKALTALLLSARSSKMTESEMKEAVTFELESIENDSSYESLEALGVLIHSIAVNKGFYDNPPSDIERMALIMEEIGDCIKALREPEMPRDLHCPEFSRLEVKLADIIIRILDYDQYKSLTVIDALFAKVKANIDRPHKHGKLC